MQQEGIKEAAVVLEFEKNELAPASATGRVGRSTNQHGIPFCPTHHRDTHDRTSHHTTSNNRASNSQSKQWPKCPTQHQTDGHGQHKAIVVAIPTAIDCSHYRATVICTIHTTHCHCIIATEFHSILATDFWTHTIGASNGFTDDTRAQFHTLRLTHIFSQAFGTALNFSKYSSHTKTQLASHKKQFTIRATYRSAVGYSIGAADTVTETLGGSDTIGNAFVSSDNFSGTFVPSNGTSYGK
mmetsp:Transcript_28483/g.66668  ORF Transcript_28483/g.66668 Transcript_28483/m.66668 type:complete len:241 (+) Transcript_28483:370-1092(+)